VGERLILLRFSPQSLGAAKFGTICGMKAFVIAMDNEAECVIRHFEDVVEERLYGRRVVRGRFAGGNAIVVVSGIGKSNAAAAAQLAIQLTGADEIVNVGVAGGLEPEMKVGDIYEVKDAVQYDFDLVQVNGTEVGTLNERRSPYIPCAVQGRFPAKTLATGDRFNDEERDMALVLRLGAGLRDMEGAAIAHVCERAGAKFVSYKCVSDVRGAGSMTGQYQENLGRCLAILADAVPGLF